jgi:hypothetical protein
MAWYVLALLLGCAIAGESAPARAAEHPPIGLNWVRLEGAESCISSAQLVERVERIGGSPRFASTLEARVFIDGSVRPVPLNAWLVVLEISDPQGRVLGHRELLARGAECHVIDEGISFLLAVYLYERPEQIDPARVMPDGLDDVIDDLFPESSELRPEELPPSTAQPPAIRAAVPHAQPRAALNVDQPAQTAAIGTTSIGASVVGTVGQLPSPGLGIAVHERFATGAGPLDLAFTYFFEQQDAVAANNGQLALTMLLGSAALCPWQPITGAFLCGGVEMGRLGVTPSGFVENRATSQLVLDGFASGVLDVRLFGPMSLRTELALVAPIVRRPFELETVNGSKQLFRMAVLSGRAQFGLSALF